MGVFSEFREFIARGNVVDLAVGVIIGAAFNDIVKVLVDQVVMPPIGLLTSGVDFAKLSWVLKADDPATEASELVAVQYGALINAGIKFFTDGGKIVELNATMIEELSYIPLPTIAITHIWN